jgi:hypothetical protein
MGGGRWRSPVARLPGSARLQISPRHDAGAGTRLPLRHHPLAGCEAGAQSARNPTLSFEFVRALFQLTAQTPAPEPLFQAPPAIGTSMSRHVPLRRYCTLALDPPADHPAQFIDQARDDQVAAWTRLLALLPVLALEIPKFIRKQNQHSHLLMPDIEIHKGCFFVVSLLTLDNHSEYIVCRAPYFLGQSVFLMARKMIQVDVKQFHEVDELHDEL